MLKIADWIDNQLQYTYLQRILVTVTVLLIIFLFIKPVITVILFFITFVLLLVYYLITESEIYLLHIKGFLGVGIIYWLLFTLTVCIILQNLTHTFHTKTKKKSRKMGIF